MPYLLGPEWHINMKRPHPTNQRRPWGGHMTQGSSQSSSGFRKDDSQGSIREETEAPPTHSDTFTWTGPVVLSGPLVSVENDSACWTCGAGSGGSGSAGLSVCGSRRRWGNFSLTFYMGTNSLFSWFKVSPEEAQLVSKHVYIKIYVIYISNTLLYICIKYVYL